MSNRHLFYATIAQDFDTLMNRYDLERRLTIVFDELLSPDLTGLRTLDLGCGTGWFSRWAAQRGAQVVSLDISRRLVEITYHRAHTQPVVGDATCLPFASACFDLIISSEMIEHLANPTLGIQEIARLLAPGGTLVLTTPNRRWLWLVNLATHLHLRPYAGYENFVGFDELAHVIRSVGLEVESHFGFHPWPFQLTSLQPLLRYLDKHYGRGAWGKWMINQALRAHKPQLKTGCG